jgi:DNA-binding LacI/PurR family transcriptional regulator
MAETKAVSGVMETLTARELKERLAARRLPVYALARVAGMWPAEVYNVLNGRVRMTELKRSRIERAIVELGLDRAPEPDPAPAVPEPVFRLRRL